MTTIQATIDLDKANAELAPLSAEQRVQWAVREFGPAAVLLSSMQKTASVLMHMFYRCEIDNEVLFTDTGFHFPETLQIRDHFLRRYRLNLVTLYPAMTPEQQERHFSAKLHLFVDGQPECCRLRKEAPFLEHMRQNGRRLVMIGIRNQEGGRRGSTRLLMPDPRIGGYALHPLLDWSSEMVANYLKENEVPAHPLHAMNYPSIGCECCTTPVEPGEDARAGRWRHLRSTNATEPMFCGINFNDGSGI